MVCVGGDVVYIWQMVQTGLVLFVCQSSVIAMSYFESQQSIGI